MTAHDINAKIPDRLKIEYLTGRRWYCRSRNTGETRVGKCKRPCDSSFNIFHRLSTYNRRSINQSINQ
jgi:hypothetical protein